MHIRIFRAVEASQLSWFQSSAEPISWIWTSWPRPTLGNWEGGRLTHLMLITALLHIQFHWQLVIYYSGFWLVNNLLWKLDISSRKEMKMTKTQFFFMKSRNTHKKKKNVKKSILAFFTVNLPHWPVMYLLNWKKIVSVIHYRYPTWSLPGTSQWGWVPKPI